MAAGEEKQQLCKPDDENGIDRRIIAMRGTKKMKSLHEPENEYNPTSTLPLIVVLLTVLASVILTLVNVLWV